MLNIHVFSELSSYSGLDWTGVSASDMIQRHLADLSHQGNSQGAAFSNPQLNLPTDGLELRIGADGDDTIYGLDGEDFIFGKSDNDLLAGNSDRDLLVGGRGDDWLNGGADQDWLMGSQGNDTLIGGSGNDYLLGGNNDDRLNGQSSDDYLWGGAGNDRLEGGKGKDILNSGGGNDVLFDLDGGDRLTGGEGDDTFHIGGASEFQLATVITDFELGNDQISLTELGATFERLALLEGDDGAEIHLNNQVIALLEGVSAADLSADSFIWGNPEFAADLQASLAQSGADGNSPGSIAAVLTADGRLWTGATGLADVENNTLAAAADRFNAGSITKPFTATVVMQLVEESVLSLDDTMAQWLPDSITSQIPNSDEITIRQLLSHTSGVNSAFMSAEYGLDLIAEPSLIFQEWTPEEVLSRYVYGREASFTPGAAGKVEYNSANYILLDLIIESATDSSLASEFRERIIDPLGLDNTFMPEEAIPGGYKPGYVDLDGDGVFDFNAGEADLVRFGGAGALISNVEDLTRFGQALFGGELVNPDTLNQMITAGVSVPTDDPLIPEIGLGLGFGYREVTGEGRHFFANGDSYGWQVRLRYDQATGTVTTLFRNGTDEIDPRDYADEALDALIAAINPYQHPPM